jgi:hypothetical protein
MVHLSRREYTQAIEDFKQALALAGNAQSESADAAQFRSHLKQAYLLSGQNDAARAVGSTTIP